MEEMKATEQRSPSLEQNARQPRLAMEAGVTIYTKTRKRTEGAAAAERAMSGDESSAEVNPDSICLASFGEDYIGPPAHPNTRDNALVDKRRCGVEAVSLTHGDVHANSRRWLTSRRQSLYNDEDHLLPAASSVLPNCGDEFWEDINLIRLVLQQFLEEKQPTSSLLAENHWNKIEVVLLVVFSPARFWERGVRCFVRSIPLGRRLVAIWNVVWQNEDFGISNPRLRYKQLVLVAVDRCFLLSQAGLNMPCRSMGAGRKGGCQGTPWSEELDSKELHGEAWW